MLSRRFLLIICALLFPQKGNAGLEDSLLFHASFDKSADADFAKGDAKIYTAITTEQQDVNLGLPSNASHQTSGGKWGGYLNFTDVSDQVVLFHGKDNVPYASGSHDLTVSMWMRVDPENGLKPGYVDPLQITDKKWNDASIFLDFTKDNPRDFRLGVFSDFKFWNPDNRDFEKLTASERPMAVMSRPPFSGDRWTHVAFTIARINGVDSIASLFVDGRRVSSLDRDQRLTWDAKRVSIMLGIQYIGGIDDLAIFDRALTNQEIQHVMRDGVANTTQKDSENLRLPQAFLTGTGPGWNSLGGADFVNVNCKEDTWKWEDGHAFCTGDPVGVIRSKDMIENFELVCEWKHKRKGGNSGVFVWASQASIDDLVAGKGRLPHGIEVQVLDLGYKELYEDGGKRVADWFTSHGDVFPTGPATMRPFPPVAPNGKRSFPSKNLTRDLNQWNHYYVRAINGEIRLWVNGEEVSGGTDCSPAKGYLCLESEGSPVEFRNIRIRRLP